MASKMRSANMSGSVGRTVEFDVAPTRGQRYNALPYDPTPPDTTISNLYTVEHQSLNVNSSDCWRERVKCELNNKKVLNDSKLRTIQKKADNRRMAAQMLPKREKTLPPAYRWQLQSARSASEGYLAGTSH